MKYLKVYQRSDRDGKSRFTIHETDESFPEVFYSWYGDDDKQIKVYKKDTDLFNLYFKNEETMNKVCKFLMMLGYNDLFNPIDTTPTSTYYIHVNLTLRHAILMPSDKAIRDYPINWEDKANHIFAYRDVSDIKANIIKIYFRNYRTARRWLDALEFIGYSSFDNYEWV